ncbi:MAG: type II toxin-antitoxin system Phd/YefM family antitoxin [Blastocatellia bacterium]
MKAVNVAELKSRLNLYLDEVKAGEEIVVNESDQPIARIIPMPTLGNWQKERLKLAADGRLILGEGPIEDSFWDMPAPELSMEVIQRVIEEDRNEG